MTSLGAVIVREGATDEGQLFRAGHVALRAVFGALMVGDECIANSLERASRNAGTLGRLAATARVGHHK